ncbi:MAG: ADP-ribosylglycohydrolase family protein [Methanoregulaceae archaeon]
MVEKVKKEELEEKFTGCILGAAIGDALGMASEGSIPSLHRMRCGYAKPIRRHPNEDLLPGQYTDDTQLMILAGTLLADGRFSVEKYGAALRDSFERGILRYPDGSVASACERLANGVEKTAVNSTTSGCISLAIPFALAYRDPRELTERASLACAVTHSHPAVHAALATTAILIHSAIEGDGDPLAKASRRASAEDQTLGTRIESALTLEKNHEPVESAILRIGNDLSVYQTVPLALFLIGRYPNPEDLLTVAVNVGGNTDTIGLICGAYAGATLGKSKLPDELLKGLEENRRIEVLGQRLYQKYLKSPRV